MVSRPRLLGTALQDLAERDHLCITEALVPHPVLVPSSTKLKEAPLEAHYLIQFYEE